MTSTPPPDLDAFARRVWVDARAAAELAGTWRDSRAESLELSARAVSSYVVAVRAAQRGTPLPGWTDLVQARQLARDIMADWLLLEPEEVEGGHIRADGVDADVASLVGLGDVLN